MRRVLQKDVRERKTEEKRTLDAIAGPENERQWIYRRHKRTSRWPGSRFAKISFHSLNFLLTGSKKQGKAPLKIEDLPKLSSVGKKDDPLLKAANEKKLKQYKEQKEKEIQQQIQTLQTKFENKKKELERQHQKKIKDLELEYEMKKAQEEDKIRRENKPLEESDIPIEKKKREAELRAEAEKNLAHKIKLLQEELSLQLEDAKEKLNLNKQQKQKEIRSQLEKQYSEEIQALESEIFKLKMEQNASAADDLESLEQNAKKSYINEQEIKFQMEKEALIQSFKEKTEELKEKALHKQREEISNLYKKFEAENAKNEVYVQLVDGFRLILNDILERRD